MRSSKVSPLLVFPHNGNGLDALDCLGDAYRFVGFADDTPEKQGTDSRGYAVMGRSALVEWADAKVLAVPGGPKSYQFRKLVIDGLGLAPGQFATIVHPTARLSPLARIGHNVLIMAGVVVTSNAVIGNHVCLLPNTVIHHDAVLGDWSLIGSNVTIAGSVIVGENCYVGSGASIMNGLQVGHKALVDIGSNVIRPVPAGSKVVGNPARQIT